MSVAYLAWRKDVPLSPAAALVARAFPARSCVQVAAIPKSARLEVEAIAVR